MSWMTAFLRVITFGIWKEKDNRSDYFKEQEGKFWYWKKDTLLVELPHQSKEVYDAFHEWREKMPSNAPRLLLAEQPEEADILIEFGDAIAKGGVCHRSPVRGTDREIAWVKIVIAKSEKGRRIKEIALHELGHGIGLTHDGARDTNLMSPNVKVREIDTQTINTVEKIYESVRRENDG